MGTPRIVERSNLIVKQRAWPATTTHAKAGPDIALVLAVDFQRIVGGSTATISPLGRIFVVMDASIDE